ncbi:MAG: ComF family protein [Lachnospiraceae bacterium]|nr:ComF family protein [Lachnospiraceae bacterium]MDE6980039.1 ComF family protein [Lachnospiraceae bacterium]
MDLLYPPRCPICDEVAAEGFSICLKCRKKIRAVEEPVCKKCGKPLGNVRQEFCSDCSKRSHAFAQGKSLWIYEKYVRDSIYRFKYQNRRDYGKVYAKEMAETYGEWICQNHIQAIVPIPLYPGKKKRRGFNQAEEAAVELGRILGIPVKRNLLIRTRDTRPQKELNVSERKNNLKKSFKSTENVVQLEYILIVDDIYTTGSTIDAASLVLREAGAGKIYFCCIGIGADF